MRGLSASIVYIGLPGAVHPPFALLVLLPPSTPLPLLSKFAIGLDMHAHHHREDQPSMHVSKTLLMRPHGILRDPLQCLVGPLVIPVCLAQSWGPRRLRKL
jgi:hypothetical protein